MLFLGMVLRSYYATLLNTSHNDHSGNLCDWGQGSLNSFSTKLQANTVGASEESRPAAPKKSPWDKMEGGGC